MKNRINSIINRLDYKSFEVFSFILLFIWAISPIIEFLLQIHIYADSSYWAISIYLIGILGIIQYIFYFYKRKIDGIKIKKFPLALITILLVIGIISSIFSDDVILSIFGESYRKEGLIVYLMYVGFILSASIIKNKNYIKIIANTVIISALYITVLPLFNRNFTYQNFTNIFHNSNHYGYFLMIAVMLAIFMFIDSKKIKKILYGIIYIFLLYILIRNDTFGCYLAVFISLIVLMIYTLFKKNKRLITSITLFLFILVSFFVSHFDIKIGERVNFDSTKGFVWNNIVNLFYDTDSLIHKNNDIEKANIAGSGRGKLWILAFNYTLDHPIIGGGMECLNKYYIKDNALSNDRPHNVLLQISSFIGIPGCIIYIIFIMYLAFSCIKKLETNSIYMMVYFTALCYFISSQFGNSMYYTSPYFMILLGLLISINEKNNLKT